MINCYCYLAINIKSSYHHTLLISQLRPKATSQRKKENQVKIIEKRSKVYGLRLMKIRLMEIRQYESPSAITVMISIVVII
ncbi:MAG: hypothetical protein ACJ72Q_04840 [Nitrososphaeraceae archaeon]